MSEKVCYYCEGSGYLMRTPKKSRKSLIKCFVCDEPAIEGITLEEFGESLKLVDAFYKGKIEDAKQHYVKWDREKVAKGLYKIDEPYGEEWDRIEYTPFKEMYLRKADQLKEILTGGK